MTVPSGTRRVVAPGGVLREDLRNGLAQRATLTVLTFSGGSSTWAVFATSLLRSYLIYSLALCRRAKRAAADRHRHHGAHHLEQHAHPPGGIEPFKRADKISKWPGEDSHRLPGRQPIGKQRQIGFVRVRDESFDD